MFIYAYAVSSYDINIINYILVKKFSLIMIIYLFFFVKLILLNLI